MNLTNNFITIFMKLFIFPTDTCFWIATPINDIEWYNKIYEIKKRDYKKPLAILVDSYDWLIKNTTINQKQINFLKNYNKPFTVLLDMKNNLLDDNIVNKSNYKKFAFRIAHNFMQNKLIRLNWPLFLTSANRTWECELFSTNNIKDIFKKEINKYNITVFAHPGFCIDKKQNFSDIFEFIWNSEEIRYIRSN